uniref:DNA ligase 3 isoform X4 n=1 Tax=Agelaius phoeniceus TaxID=39638 RepID=UPI0023EC7878|nr:DNA ligase 3 isoform X4 [Agelaius phoeniceus]
MPTGGRTLSHAARALGRGTALFCPRPQLPVPRPLSRRAGARCGCWCQLLFQPVPVPSPQPAFPLSLLLGSWLRSACAAAGDMAEQRYCVDYAKRGTAGCKKCKEKIVKGMVRIGKIVPNPFTESGGDMKEWYHVKCIFEKLDKARATTKKIEDITDLEGWEELQDEEKETINKYISEANSKTGGTPKKKVIVQAKLTATGQLTTKDPPKKFSGFSAKPKSSEDSPAKCAQKPSLSAARCDPQHKDCLLREFRKLCAMVAEKPSYNVKTQIIQDFLRKGSAGDGFHGDVYLTIKMLLPGVIKIVYNLNDKQIVKLFSRIFNCNQEEMVRDLEQGDVSETIRIFFEQSKTCPPAAKSLLTIQEVDEFLMQLSKLTKEDDQQSVLQQISRRCTGNDLKCIIRLIKHDLKMNAGAKHVLDALDPNAYEAFKASRNLQDVVERVLQNQQEAEKVPGLKKTLSVQASLMTPVQPMLAEACKSIEYAMKKCPNGMYAEIKYDGERVQVHKNGDHFSYFSRSLKPVLPHKVAHFKDFIPQAFPGGQSMILDSEVLLIDNKTGKPLPFGTLGVHKKAAFQDANVCLFVFDCIYFNDISLMDRPLCERRKFLHDNMVEIPNRILFSEMKHVTKASDLADMITRVIREGLEGLVLKDIKGNYEPGKRHWLKVKKDYLNEGAMADTADLVVLGAFYGQGSKGGMMSIFLMGCYDPKSEKWCTVTKCSGGHDDATLARLQTELDMVKISKDPSKIPRWLKINKIYYPDFIVPDPKPRCGRSQGPSSPRPRRTRLTGSPSASRAAPASGMTRTGRQPPTCSSSRSCTSSPRRRLISVLQLGRKMSPQLAAVERMMGIPGLPHLTAVLRVPQASHLQKPRRQKTAKESLDPLKNPRRDEGRREKHLRWRTMEKSPCWTFSRG